MDEYLRIKNKDIEGIKSVNVSELVANDPASVSDQFKRRIDAVWKELILGTYSMYEDSLMLIKEHI